MAEPTASRLTPSLIAAYRSGCVVCLEPGAPTGIRAKHPAGYELRGEGGVVAAPLVATPEPPPEPLVAIVQVRGVLEQRATMRVSGCGETQTDGYDAIESRFFGWCDYSGEQHPGALTDENVSAIVLDVDSPGGDLAGLEQTIARVRAGVLASGKPCVGFVNEFAASAALWMLVGICDAVYLPPSGLLGSVGCYVFFQSEARHLLEDDKVDTYIARQPDGKARPHPAEPLDPIGQARLDARAVVGEAAFVAAVAKLRGLTPEEVRGWNGQIFIGEDAVTVGLADGIGSLEDVVALARELSGMKAAA